VAQQTANAHRVAEFLARQANVSRVYYPGLEDAPGHAVARAQMAGFGAMLSFALDPRQVGTDRFLRHLQLIRPAVSLGGVETTICAPAVTSHAKMSPQERARVGVTEALLRLSVGIEHVDDLIDDLGQALKQAAERGAAALR
jgi:cystathionine beta-lyase